MRSGVTFDAGEHGRMRGAVALHGYANQQQQQYHRQHKLLLFA